MMEHNIITAKDSQKEQMNSRIIQVTNLEVYLTYYMILLNIANEIGIISKERVNTIHKFIKNVVVDDAGSRMVVIANMFYILSTYLQTMPLYEAYEMLEGITSTRTARDLIEKSQSFWKVELQKQISILNSVRKKVHQLNVEKIIKQFNEFNIAISAVASATVNSAVNLKELHKSVGIFMSFYVTMKSADETNVLTKLKTEIISFVTEISILAKFNTQRFIKQVNEEMRKLEKLQEKQLANLEKEQKRQTTIASKLFEQQKVEKIAKQEAAGLSSKQILQNLANEWYDIQKEIERKIALREEEIEKITIFLNNECTLHNVIIKYALYSLAKKEELVYPETIQEREILAEKISLKIVIREILESTEKWGFTESEVKYLQSIV